MTSQQDEKKPASVDKSTAKGKGEGGFAPHPKADTPDRPASYDPKYRANVEPPPVKPVGQKKA